MVALEYTAAITINITYLEEDEWKGDTIPEFMDGKNVMEFFSSDIEERLKALDEEEAALEAQGAYADSEDDGEGIDEEEQLLYDTIKKSAKLQKWRVGSQEQEEQSQGDTFTRTGRMTRENSSNTKGYNADKAIESMLNVKKGGQKREEVK